MLSINSRHRHTARGILYVANRRIRILICIQVIKTTCQHRLSYRRVLLECGELRDPFRQHRMHLITCFMLEHRRNILLYVGF